MHLASAGTFFTVRFIVRKSTVFSDWKRSAISRALARAIKGACNGAGLGMKIALRMRFQWCSHSSSSLLSLVIENGLPFRGRRMHGDRPLERGRFSDILAGARARSPESRSLQLLLEVAFTELVLQATLYMKHDVIRLGRVWAQLVN